MLLKKEHEAIARWVKKDMKQYCDNYDLNMLTIILRDLKKKGRSCYCPGKNHFCRNPIRSNSLCHRLFPEILFVCPCVSDLSTEILIDRVEMLIETILEKANEC